MRCAVLCCAAGLTTGMVVDSGDGVTHIVAVADSYVLPHLTKRLNIAGRDITRQLIKLLLLRGCGNGLVMCGWVGLAAQRVQLIVTCVCCCGANSYAFNRTADFQTVQELKEKFCYTACVRVID